jgi:diaminopimelate epimerase
MVTFFKYQGTGNDFIIIDNREMGFSSSAEMIEKMCDRRFGIGADGLMLLQNKPGYDFEMIYFNADGKESSMCGNGGRCIVAFAADLQICTAKAFFLAVDGDHDAIISERSGNKRHIGLKMIDVPDFRQEDEHYILNTGSPHYVQFTDEEPDVVSEGKKIRYSEPFKKDGINVNFVRETGENEIIVNTYERGVEDETYSCGTGVTAAALCSGIRKKSLDGNINVQTKGGILNVSFTRIGNGFANIWLNGPATFVFKGEY